MAVAAIVMACDVGKLPELIARKRAVRHRHPQHGRESLDVEAVAQAQLQEFIVRQLARQITLSLVTIVRDALVDELAVKIVVAIHVRVNAWE